MKLSWCTRRFFLKPGDIDDQNQTESIIWSLPLLGMPAPSPCAWCLQVVMSGPNRLVSISRAGWYTTKFTKNVTKLKIGLYHISLLLPLLFSWHQSVCSVCSWMLCPWGSLGTYQHLSTLLLPSSFLCCLVYKWLIFKCSSWSVFQLTEVWRSASHWIKITGKHPNTSEHHR